MELGVRLLGTVTLITVHGSIDETGADQLSRKFGEISAQNRHDIVLDLGDVDFITSSGIGAIMTMYKISRAKGGHVRIVNPQPLIMDVFTTTKLVRLFPIYPNVEEALKGT